MNTIQSLMKENANNYDFIRLLAAIIVIFSHSFPLSMGYINGQDPDPLFQTSGHFTIGHIGVMIFFIISGFLITQSYERASNPITFLKARVLRIFPGLFFVLLLTVFVLGPSLTKLPNQEYFSLKSTYDYFKNITLFNMVYTLPGMFENNAFPNTVNGSLWTLVYEFLCYFVVLLLGFIKLFRKEVIVILFITSSILYLNGTINEFFTYFSAGMLAYMFKEKIVLNSFISHFSTIIAIGCIIFYEPFLLPLISICVMYTVMSLVYDKTVNINGSKFGDLSYGTYVYAFPIQQSVTYFFGGHMYWWMNFLISLPITLFFAAISWHLIERHALKLRRVSFTEPHSSLKKAS